MAAGIEHPVGKVMQLAFWVLLVGLAVLPPSVVQARARDEVMSGAYRCSPIADTRQWLDCYYGAAQPVRAQLGLSSALANQMHLAMSPPESGAASDVATRTEVMVAASRCYAIAGERPWLDCYYGAAQPIRDRLGLPPSQRLPTRDLASKSTSNPIPLASSSAGLAEDNQRPRQVGLSNTQSHVVHNGDRIVSRMSSYMFDQYGIFTVTLANGQTWRQLSGDTDYAHWKKPAAAYVVSISHGFLGSYNFEVKNSGVFKVERLN
jgi:hypothetical protein